MSRPYHITLKHKHRNTYDYRKDPIDKQNCYQMTKQCIQKAHLNGNKTTFTTHQLSMRTGLTGHNIYKNAIRQMINEGLLILEAPHSRCNRWRIMEDRWKE